jgi:hypothetical protein
MSGGNALDAASFDRLNERRCLGLVRKAQVRSAHHCMNPIKGHLLLHMVQDIYDSSVCTPK